MSSQPRVPPWYRRVPWHVLAFLAPAVVIYTVFMVFPLFDSLRLSLFDEEGVFTGLDNYARLLGDQRVWDSMSVTLRFAVLWLPVSILVPFVVALGLNSKWLRGGSAMRSLFFMPYVVPFVAGRPEAGSAKEAALRPATLKV